MEILPFTIQRLDHINVLVPDRHEAAQWYQRIFGLKPLHGRVFEMAVGIPDGPLFLGIDDDLSHAKVALLVGEPLGQHDATSISRVAFGVDGASFLRFLNRLDELVLTNEKGEHVTRDHVVDQWIGWSLFFSDPYGNRFELVTYDYEIVQTQLNAAKA
jgi:catechol 2,3-dioxygenase-like lactoylglutathione lyase family enzyme